MSELVLSRANESTEGFEVLPLPPVEREVSTANFEVFDLPRGRGRPKGSKNKTKAEAKPAKAVKAEAKPKSKRGRGRPRVYNGTQRRIVAAAIRHRGLTRGIEFLAKERGLNVSMTLARDVAEEFEISLKRGRPVVA